MLVRPPCLPPLSKDGGIPVGFGRVETREKSFLGSQPASIARRITAAIAARGFSFSSRQSWLMADGRNQPASQPIDRWVRKGFARGGSLVRCNGPDGRASGGRPAHVSIDRMLRLVVHLHGFRFSLAWVCSRQGFCPGGLGWGRGGWGGIRRSRAPPPML